MKFKCIFNIDHEDQITVGKVYDGENWNRKSDFDEPYVLSKPYIKIKTCDDGVEGIFLSYRFEEV